MKILEATSRESESLTGTEYLPFSDSSDSTDGRVSTGVLKTYIASELEETVATNASDIDALQTSVKTNTTNIATNASDIDALEASVATNTTNIATNASDIEQLMNYAVLPFDGFAYDTTGWSLVSEDPASEVYNIYFDVKNNRFVNSVDSAHYYSSWETDESSDDLYNDEDGIVRKDKLFLYNGQIYTWDEDEETLTIVVPKALKKYVVMPFDGFLEDSSGYSALSGTATDANNIYFEVQNSRFISDVGNNRYYYLSWETDESSDDLYNDDDGVVLKDKLFLYNGQIYTWDDDEETLVVVKPEVIDNLTSEDTDVALSANQGKVLNEAIEANASDIDVLETTVSMNTTNIATNANDITSLKTSVATNASDIETLQTSVATNTTNIATNTSDIETLQTSVATNTTNIATNTSDIETLQTSVATNTTNIETLQTTVDEITSVSDGDIEEIFE